MNTKRADAHGEQINEIVEKILHPQLQNLHLPLYHSNPEYHASFAWCLIDETTQGSKEVAFADHLDGFEDSSQQTPIPDRVIMQLNDDYRDSFLRSQPLEGWSISEIELKIGKDVKKISLRSA